MWSNLLRKKTTAKTFYFAAEEKSVCKRKKSVSVNSMSKILMQAFGNTRSAFHMEKTEYQEEKA